MRRSWNSLIWVGFAITLAAAFSYVPIFVHFAATRDFPWVNLLLFLTGGFLLAAGFKRALTEPERYGGKISGAILGTLALLLFGFFCWGNFVFARHVPSSTTAPRPGATAPDFTLPDANGKPVALSELRRANRAVLLIFYRGYW
jgi:hypothetical protein